MKNSKKSITEQILDNTIKNLEPKKEFNKEIIKKLKDILSSNDFKNQKKVLEILKCKNKNENK